MSTSSGRNRPAVSTASRRRGPSRTSLPGRRSSMARRVRRCPGCRPPPGCGGRRRGPAPSSRRWLRGFRGGARSGSRQADDELAPPAPARRFEPRRSRRASRPGRLTSASPMPSPPCDRSRRRSTCANISNSRRACSAGMPMPLSRDRTPTTSRALCRSRGQPDPAALLGVLGARCSAGCRTPGPAAPGRRPGTIGSGGSAHRQLVAAALDRAAGSSPTASSITVAQLHPLLRGAPASPGDAAHVEQVVDEPQPCGATWRSIIVPRGLPTLRLGAAPVRRSCTRVADGGERVAELVGRASPGTRPSSGPPRGGPRPPAGGR